jgi:hypothetical protein
MLPGGSDVVAVYGSQASDVITASASQVTLLGQTINLASLETLEVLGAGGEDEFRVTAGPVEIRVDGGDPIGSPLLGDQAGTGRSGRWSDL